jgi:hypothetical protein
VNRRGPPLPRVAAYQPANCQHLAFHARPRPAPLRGCICGEGTVPDRRGCGAGALYQERTKDRRRSRCDSALTPPITRPRSSARPWGRTELRHCRQIKPKGQTWHSNRWFSQDIVFSPKSVTVFREWSPDCFVGAPQTRSNGQVCTAQ